MLGPVQSPCSQQRYVCRLHEWCMFALIALSGLIVEHLVSSSQPSQPPSVATCLPTQRQLTIAPVRQYRSGEAGQAASMPSLRPVTKPATIKAVRKTSTGKLAEAYSPLLTSSLRELRSPLRASLLCLDLLPGLSWHGGSAKAAWTSARHDATRVRCIEDMPASQTT